MLSLSQVRPLALVSLLQKTYHECHKVSNEQRYWAKTDKKQAKKNRALEESAQKQSRVHARTLLAAGTALDA